MGAEPSGPRRSIPDTEVPRWVMLCRWTRSGRAGTSSSEHSGRQGLADGLDDHAVFGAVLGRGQELAGEDAPALAGPVGGPGQGPAPDPEAGPFHQELGAGPDQVAVGRGHREDRAGGLHPVPPAEERHDVDGVPHPNVDVAGHHHLGNLTGLDGPDRLGHHGAERGVGRSGGDGREPGRAGTIVGAATGAADRGRRPTLLPAGAANQARSPEDPSGRSAGSSATTVTHSPPEASAP